MTANEAQLAYLRRLMAERRPGSGPLAIVAEDGAWVDGGTMTLDAYRGRYEGQPRREVKIAGIRLEDLQGRFF
jgi:hypothetical protein